LKKRNLINPVHLEKTHFARKYPVKGNENNFERNKCILPSFAYNKIEKFSIRGIFHD